MADTTSDADKILRLLIRFGLDKASADQVTRALNDQEHDLKDIITQWQQLRQQAGLTESETVTAIKGSITGMQLEEDQIRKIGKAYEAQQAAEQEAAASAKADSAARTDQLSKIANQTKQISESFTSMIGAGRFLSEIGRAGTVFGGLFGDKVLQDMGKATVGLGDIVMAAGRLPQAFKAAQSAVKEFIDVYNTLGAGPSLALGAATGAGIAGLLQSLKYAEQTVRTVQLGQQQPEVEQALAALPAEQKAAEIEKLNEALKGVPADQAIGVYDQWAQEVLALSKEAEKATKKTVELTDAEKMLGAQSSEQAGKALEAAAKYAGAGGAIGSVFDTLGRALDTIGSKGVAIQQAIALQAKLPDMLTAYSNYQQDAAKADQKYGEERAKIAQDTGQQIADITQKFDDANLKAYQTFAKEAARATQDYEQQRIKIMTSGVSQEQQAEQTYYQNRTKAAENYELEIQRMEQDHQKQMLRMSEDHGVKIQKLAETRDALGIADENASYERDRRRAEEDYQTNAARKSQDFARQMADQEQQFREQKASRDADRARQLAELKQQFEQQQARRQQDYTDAANERAVAFNQELDKVKQNGIDKQAELDRQHQQEIDDLKASFEAKRVELGFLYDGERALVLQKQAVLLQDWTNFFDQAQAVIHTGEDYAARHPTPTTQPTGIVAAPQTQVAMTPFEQRGGYGYQAGGYARGGPAFLHSGEFVMNAQTTAAMEKLAGRRLNQEDMLALAGGSRGTFAPTVNVNVGPVNGGNPDQIAALVKSGAYEAIVEVFNEVMK